jgi:hypothetical protein
MEPDFKMSKVHAWGWCLQLHAPTLVEGLLPIFSSLCLDEASAKMMAETEGQVPVPVFLVPVFLN